MAPGRNQALAEALDGVRRRTWVWIPGQVDIWGLPITGDRPRLG